VNNYHCSYCNKDGHSEDQCFRKKKDEKGEPEKITSENEQSLCVYETALATKAKEKGFITDQTFIVDTGASIHMVFTKKYLTNIMKGNTKITAGNNDLIRKEVIEAFW
jgi:hypothetical protein